MLIHEEALDDLSELADFEAGHTIGEIQGSLKENYRMTFCKFKKTEKRGIQSDGANVGQILF